jgi:hypothetical protein
MQIGNARGYLLDVVSNDLLVEGGMLDQLVVEVGVPDLHD